METIQTIILAIIQGLTEFLPISSSAHLILISQMSGWSDQGLLVDVALHFGTLLAVIYYFRSEIVQMFEPHHFSSTQTLLHSPIGIITIATVPIVIVGGLFNEFIEQNLRSPSIIAIASIFFGILLYFADLKHAKKDEVLELTLLIGLLIGLSQILALIPGTSRSGITITMGLFLGLSRVEALKFSFMLAIPVIVAATILQSIELFNTQLIDINYLPLFLGVFISFIIAFLTIRWFIEFVNRIGMLPFVIYRIFLGVIIFLTL